MAPPPAATGASRKQALDHKHWLLHKGQQSFGSDPHLVGIKCLGQETGTVILDELQLLRRNIDRIGFDHVGIWRGWSSVHRRNEFVGKRAIVSDLL